MTAILEANVATARNISPELEPKKLKNYRPAPTARPGAAKCGVSPANSVTRKEYLRALRAAEMAAWAAAGQTVESPVLAPVTRLPGSNGTFADERVAAWESRLYVALIMAAIIGVLANAGALSHFVDGWTQFAGLVGRILS